MARIDGLRSTVRSLLPLAFALLLCSSLLGACSRTDNLDADAPVTDSPTTEVEVALGEMTEGAGGEPSVVADEAVLVSGPTPGRGIEFLPPNVLPYQAATYRVSEGVISVYALDTQDQLWRLESSYTCGGEPFGIAETRNGEVHVYSSDELVLLVVFPPEFASPCDFLTPLLQQIRFFQGAAPDDPVVPYPAFLDLPR